MSDKVKLHLGLKSDPIEYRYSYDWLFRILSEEGVRFMQLGTFFELYHLPDHAITSLREKAAQYGVEISSVFTAHRELGGFFINDTAWQEVAFNDYRRLIRVSSLLGARSVGSNPGAVMRDRMETKAAGIRCYVEAMKKLMHYACEQGVETLAIEPMSCLAEPPTLPEEIVSIGEELREYHLANPGSTAQTGYCFDVSHGYVDCSRVMRYSNLDMFEAALPYLTEIHLKNTDANLESTFGFTAKDRARGIVDPGVFRKRLLAGSAQLPSTDLIGYLEIGGPKLGRDYSDAELENQLRESLRYLQKTFACGETSQPEALAEEIRPISVSAPTIKIAPSM
ncbi:MAG: TIM barrel protein, partial [Acidobacteriaceae bacterium]|nr:TIM barrel protein [Acidobacteriaceae bacterium]